jgi:hypothetical protein
MTDEEIHNIYLHMSGKAEGLVEATGKADFPVMFARAILEYDRRTKDSQNRNEVLEEVAKEIEKFKGFGEDTIASFTVYIRNMKR